MDFDFSIDFIALAQIFVALFVFAQGVIVLVQNHQSNLNRSFFFFQLSVFIWMFGMGLAYFSNNEEVALVFAKLGFIGVSTIPITTYLFSVYFAGIKPNKPSVIISVLFGIFLIININNTAFVKGIIHYPWGNYIYLGVGGFISIMLFLYFLTGFGRNLYIVYRKADRRKKWYLLAFIFGILSFVGIVDFLPAYGI